MDPNKITAVMDANCALCARGAAWIARNDLDEQFQIVPVQSPLGEKLMRAEGLDPADPSSWLVIDAAGTHLGLEALIAAGAHLGGIWRGLTVLRLLPRPVRDAVYGLVARNRYRVFGRADLCRLPDAQVQRRLLKGNVG
ncbi:MAG: DCC1-like thiol-disulfide oxidoreductase family protein [Pseudomonadota bacterium]